MADFHAARISFSEAWGATSRTSYQLGVATVVVVTGPLPSPG